MRTVFLEIPEPSKTAHQKRMRQGPNFTKSRATGVWSYHRGTIVELNKQTTSLDSRHYSQTAASARRQPAE
jgi:hypothetical protein